MIRTRVGGKRFRQRRRHRARCFESFPGRRRIPCSWQLVSCGRTAPNPRPGSGRAGEDGRIGRAQSSPVERRHRAGPQRFRASCSARPGRTMNDYCSTNCRTAPKLRHSSASLRLLRAIAGGPGRACLAAATAAAEEEDCLSSTGRRL